MICQIVVILFWFTKSTLSVLTIFLKISTPCRNVSVDNLHSKKIETKSFSIDKFGTVVELIGQLEPFFFNCGADSFKSPKCDRKMLKVTVIIRNVTAKCCKLQL